MILNFKKFEKDANTFINALSKSLNCADDKDKAARILRSVLHALRGQLTNEESVQLIAQFPFFLKAVYVTNWKYQQTKPERIKHYDQFIEKVYKEHGKIAARDFQSNDEVECAISIVFLELRKYITLGELEDIRSVLPKELKPMLNNVLML